MRKQSPLRFLGQILGLVGAGQLVSCSSVDTQAGPPPCGSNENGLSTLIPGPGSSDFDEALAARARRHDRLFHAVFAQRTGLNADYSFNGSPEQRALFESFLRDDDGYEFEAATGVAPLELGVWHKSAGLYGGVGVAADAFRYGALRDSGAACEEQALALSQLVRGMEGMDVGARIGGVPGVNARALARPARPGEGHAQPLPLFDESGSPLPPEKNNGQWRDDQTGDYEGWFWEDSLSRDMLVGWAMAYGAVWEVVKDDPLVDENLKQRLKENARATAKALMKVGEFGYDLEIPDADGRLTFHAYINENSVDRLYIPGAENGFNAVMGLGIVAAYAYAAEDPEIDAYLQDQLVAARNLPAIVERDMLVVDLGVGSNFSNFNMAFTGMFLAQRYVFDERGSTTLRVAVEHELYNKREANERKPVEMGQSFFDFIYAAGKSGARADRAGDKTLDTEALARGLKTLADFPESPVWGRNVENCDEDEIAAGVCVLNDGTEVRILGEVGWNDKLVVDKIVPMAVRPISNYYWRSPPYAPNGNSGENNLVPAVDFRVAYWMGRWIRVVR